MKAAESIVAVLLESESKYWLSPIGEKIRCDLEHGDAAREILGIPEPGITDPDEYMMWTSETRDKLMAKGWVRVNILHGTALYADYVRPPNRAQLAALRQWADELGVELVGI